MTLQETLAQFVPAKKLEDAVTAVEAYINALPKNFSRRSQADITTSDGTVYRFCCWAQAYFPLEDFVGTATSKKNYSKEAYKIWRKIQTDAQKELGAISHALMAKAISDAEARAQYELIQQKLKDKTNVAHYQHLGGLTEEAVRQL